MNPVKIFVFTACAAIAALATAYFVGAFDRAPAPGVAQISTQPTAPAAPPASEPAAPTANEAAEAAAPAANEPAEAATGNDGEAAQGEAASSPTVAPSQAPATAGAAGLVVPSFDLLRVESDGSIVIAGKAEPSSEVEVINGSTTVGRTRAGPSGDFAIVLDAPLKPGDHQLVLRSTSDKSVVSSPETAVVSIPDQPGGQVLALVEAPGKPSALITVPKATSPVAGSDQAPAQAAPSTGVPAAQSAPAPTAESTGQQAAADAPSSAPASGGASATAGQAATTGTGSVAVEAVEIEGRQIFVAGRAAPGQTVRVYANDQLLGHATVEANGRFLVEAQRDLAVGDYIIRADVLGKNGVDVVARAAVPFEREAGESIAAVAPQPGGAADQAEHPSASYPSAIPDESADLAEGTADGGTNNDSGTAQAGTAAQSEDRASVSAKLEKVDGSVIIRRGDSLWRISKRVYGRGVRYSTIYLANQSQIADPNRIWPGQVFRVPGETSEGEAADFDALGDKARQRVIQ